ncbi:MAG: UDP-N-acetylmuramoyl-L-alanyl-D-glutamate--2,6-diaminopimelate ligase [Acidimicrobiales bacterium]
MTETMVGPVPSWTAPPEEHPPRALLSALAEHFGGGERRGDSLVSGICGDSRRVRPGNLFLAVSGAHVDGHRFASDAVRRGAAALVVERFLEGLDVPQLRMPSVSAAAGPLAAHLYGSPSERLPVVGVTGTNGKTTTCQLLQACLAGPTGVAGQIGTTGTYLGGRRLATSALSTPEAPELQRHLFAMLQAGAAGAAVEVTSHGLDRHRVDGTRFRVGVFLNLSPEHLDYHGSMERYFAAKQRLFEVERCDHAVVCVDGDWGERLAASCPIPVTTFARHRPADVRIRCTSRGLAGIAVDVHEGNALVVLESPLVGPVNSTNVAAAYLAARVLGVSEVQARLAIAHCPAPPGRFEVVSAGEPNLVVVDYAHTPDALEALVATARHLAKGKVHLVLGARGERYAAKRPEMARVATEADQVVFTSDSPGIEDPQAIVADMIAGVPDDQRRKTAVEIDRESAICRAVSALEPGDILLVTGRGHETTQRFGDTVVPLDDRVAVRLALTARTGPSRADAGDPLGVGVVIPAHNAEETLADAITSVLTQTRPPEELVVVDDGSTDGTAAVARSFGDRVRLVEQPCLGPSAARNAGVSLCQAPLVAFLDADDLWQQEKLERQVEALDTHRAVLCASDWIRSNPVPLAGSSPTTSVTTDDLLVLNRFQTSTVLVRRTAFARARGFSPRLDGAEDWDLWLRLSRLGSIVKLNSPLVCYRDHPTGYSKDLRRHHDAVLEIVRRELVEAESTRSREIRAWHHLRFAVAFARFGDRSRAGTCLRMLCREHLLLAALPASTNLLIPFLAGRARRRLSSRFALLGAS